MTEIIPWIQRPDTMRIAFAGSAGTGKTTLALAVNEHLGFPTVMNIARDWMKENKVNIHDVHGRALMKAQMEIFKKKTAMEAAHKQFIADRSILDAMCYALNYLSNEEEMQRGLMDYVYACTRHASATYDVIFTLPYGVIPFEEDGTRKPMPAHQITIHMLIEHAVALGIGAYHVHQVQSMSLEDRVAEVLHIVDQLTIYKKEYESKELEDKALKDEIGDIVSRHKLAPKGVQ